jgi:hypothetical protein
VRGYIIVTGGRKPAEKARITAAQQQWPVHLNQKTSKRAFTW